MLPRWVYHKGMYKCPKCNYLVTRDYVIEHSVKVVGDRNLKCSRCENVFLVGYIGSTK